MVTEIRGIATNAANRWLARSTPDRATRAVRIYGAMMVCAGLVVACSPDAAPDGMVDASEALTAPPGWPLEIGDTIALGALRDMMPRFRPMSWTSATDLAHNPEWYEPKIRASKYGIATFESTLIEAPRDYKYTTTMFACPPEGFELVDGVHAETLDGATIIDLPPDIPCDPNKRFVTGKIYVGQVR